MVKQRLNINSEFIRNGVTLIGGTVLAQAIPILLQPLLRRLYTAEEFGAMAVYLNLFGIITIVSSLRYEAAVMLPKHNNEAANVLGLSFLINVFINGLILLVLAVALKPIASLIGLSGEYAPYLFFLPLSGLAFGFYQNINYWLIRQKAFRASTQNKVARRAMEGMVQVAGGVLKNNGGLFVGDLAGNLINVISGVRQLVKNSFRFSYLSVRKLKWAMVRYKEFPLYNALPTLASSLATTLPYLYLNKFYSTQVVGEVDLCKLALSVPLVFVSGTLSQLLFQDITERKSLGKPILAELKKVAIIVLAVFVGEVIVVELLAPQLFSFVFGAKYAVSGEYGRILVFSFGLNFIASTFSFLLITFQKLKLNAIWQLAYLAGISSLYFCKEQSLSGFLWIFISIDVFFQLLLIGIFVYVVKSYKPKQV